jgi:hypothetical protein
MHFQHRGSFTDESAGFLSQYIVYRQACQIEPPGFHFLPKYKPGKFSKSPKVCSPNVDFFALSIFNLDSVIVGGLKEKGVLDPLGRTPKAQKKARRGPGLRH